MRLERAGKFKPRSGSINAAPDARRALEELGIVCERRQPATRASQSRVRADRQKSYAVGLEKPCPGGACDWAPEIPSSVPLAGFAPSKYELVHKSWSFFVKRAAILNISKV
jgi:hypothetical protein